MKSISGSDPMPIRVAREVSSNGSFIEQKAKSIGVPDNVIAQGPTAIKAWAQEHGKIPASTSKQPDSAANQANSNLQTGRLELTTKLEAHGPSYDRFGQTPAENTELTKELHASHPLRVNITA